MARGGMVSVQGHVIPFFTSQLLIVFSYVSWELKEFRKFFLLLALSHFGKHCLTRHKVKHNLIFAFFEIYLKSRA